MRPGFGSDAATRSNSSSSQRRKPSYVSLSGRERGCGGIAPTRSLRTTFSQSSRSAATLSTSAESRASPTRRNCSAIMPVPLPATTRSLWQVTQYRSRRARCGDTPAPAGSHALREAPSRPPWPGAPRRRRYRRRSSLYAPTAPFGYSGVRCTGTCGSLTARTARCQSSSGCGTIVDRTSAHARREGCGRPRAGQPGDGHHDSETVCFQRFVDGVFADLAGDGQRGASPSTAAAPNGIDAPDIVDAARGEDTAAVRLLSRRRRRRRRRAARRRHRVALGGLSKRPRDRRAAARRRRRRQRCQRAGSDTGLAGRRQRQRRHGGASAQGRRRPRRCAAQRRNGRS